MPVPRKRSSKDESSPAAVKASSHHTTAPKGYESINPYTVRDKAPLTPAQLQEYADLQKRVNPSEFGGVIGTPLLTFALPVVIYWVWASIEFNNGYLLRPQVYHHTVPHASSQNHITPHLYSSIRLSYIIKQHNSILNTDDFDYILYITVNILY